METLHLTEEKLGFGSRGRGENFLEIKHLAESGNTLTMTMVLSLTQPHAISVSKLLFGISRADKETQQMQLNIITLGRYQYSLELKHRLHQNLTPPF